MLASMDDLSFEWDPRKDAQNQRKHGISFQEALTVFYGSMTKKHSCFMIASTLTKKSDFLCWE